MSQPYDLFHQPPMSVAIKRRDTILAKVQESAGAEFSRRAAEFILNHLREHGPTPGEDITDACKAAGIVPPKDDRAVGSVYMSLSRRALILKHGYCQRRKGNATAGGVIWKLNPKAQ